MEWEALTAHQGVGAPCPHPATHNPSMPHNERLRNEDDVQRIHKAVVALLGGRQFCRLLVIQEIQGFPELINLLLAELGEAEPCHGTV